MATPATNDKVPAVATPSKETPVATQKNARPYHSSARLKWSALLTVFVLFTAVMLDLYPNLSWHFKKTRILKTIGMQRTDALAILEQENLKASWLPYTKMLNLQPNRSSLILRLINNVVYDALKPENYEQVAWLIDSPFAILTVDSSDNIADIEFGY